MRRIRTLENFIGRSWPRPDRRSLSAWANDELKLPGSLRSEKFNLSISPWMREPMDMTDDPEVRRLLLMGPVQGGKSVEGEAFIVKRLATDPGSLLYNWENQVKAGEIWNERFANILRVCEALRYRLPPPNTRQKKMEVMFNDGMFFRMQGIEAEGARQSKSVRYLVNEEVKDWSPGTLTDLRNRVTAAWNSFELNITPASLIGDEVHTLWKESSQHMLHITCPKCKTLQIPRFRADKEKPGGLRICDPASDAEKARCKRGDHDYSYQDVHDLHYYECENPDCRHRMRDEPKTRSSLAAAASYVQMNYDCFPSDRACRYNALIVPWVSWLDLIREFHRAVQAMRYGDIELYKTFIQKREVEFFDPDPESLPMQSTVHVRTGIVKSRDGLSDRDYRFMCVDVQRGRAGKGESQHHWVTVRDWAPGKSALVWEGKVALEEDVEALREELGVEAQNVTVDSGDGATVLYVYRMCAKYGYLAIKGEDRASYIHADGDVKHRKPYSPMQTQVVSLEGGEAAGIYLMLYSKQGIRDILHYLRTSEFDFQIPEDVSEDYIEHMDAEHLVDHHIPKTGQVVPMWKQRRRRNDLFVCECYQALLAEIGGLVGTVPLQERPTVASVSPSRG